MTHSEPAEPAPLDATASQPDESAKKAEPVNSPAPAREQPHPNPTRYGDWEVRGRCIDF